MSAGQETILDDYAFLVSETDAKGNILFANNDFCKIAEYTLDELIGKPHSMVRHKDMPKIAFKGLWDTIAAGKTWNGIVKNKTKNGDYYWVNATAYEVIKNDGTHRLISVRKKPTQEEVAFAETLYQQLKKEEY